MNENILADISTLPNEIFWSFFHRYHSILYFKDIRRSYTLGPILGAEITYCCYPRHRLIQS